MHSFENNTYVHFKYLAIKQLKGFCGDPRSCFGLDFCEGIQALCSVGPQ